MRLLGLQNMYNLIASQLRISAELHHHLRCCSTAAAAMEKHKYAAVLYHYPCPDGVFAALAAHLYFSATSLPVRYFPNTVYDPIRSNCLPLDEISDVYLLDFVGPDGFVADISSKVESVIILDHHKTALEALSGNSSIDKNVTKILDMNRSGATIAFDFFREKFLARNSFSENKGPTQFIPEGKHDKICRLFSFIEDGDLWRWALPDSQAFSSGLKDLNMEYNVNANPSLFDQLLALDPDYVVTRGKETLALQQKLIQEALEQSYEIELGNGLFGRCLAVDADSISHLRSELGNQLAIKSRNLGLRGIGAVVYKVPELNNDQMLKISLRSLDSEDTTSISKEYGGGGHRNASSFLLNCTLFDKWKLQVN